MYQKMFLLWHPNRNGALHPFRPKWKVTELTNYANGRKVMDIVSHEVLGVLNGYQKVIIRKGKKKLSESQINKLAWLGPS